MSYDNLVDTVKSALAFDAFNNPDKVEDVRVSEQDISDCPDLFTARVLFADGWGLAIDVEIMDCTAGMVDDINHEFAMEELVRYA